MGISPDGAAFKTITSRLTPLSPSSHLTTHLLLTCLLTLHVAFIYDGLNSAYRYVCTLGSEYSPFLAPLGQVLEYRILEERLVELRSFLVSTETGQSGDHMIALARARLTRRGRMSTR